MSKKLLLNNESQVLSIDPEYNYFVINVDEQFSFSRDITISDNTLGDDTPWDGLTDWGDGTIDSSLDHLYENNGIYTIKTKYSLYSSSGGPYNAKLREMVIDCLNINKNVKDFRYVFYDLKNIEKISISDWRLCTDDLTDQGYVFYYCPSLKSLNLNGFKLYKLDHMFEGCSSLVSLDLSYCDTSEVKGISWYTFCKCTSLKYLNLSGWDLSRTSSLVMSMFDYCDNLTLDNINMTGCNDTTVSRITDAFNNRRITQN